MVAEPETSNIDLERIDEPLAAFLDRVADGRRRVVVRRGGRPLVLIEPVAAPLSDKDIEFLREVSDLFADVPLDEIEREVDAAVADVRRRRTERQAT